MGSKGDAPVTPARRPASEWRVVLLYCLPVVIGLFMLFYVRGADHYAAPKFGGEEPAFNHVAALDILRTGRTDMMFHPTGYAYLTAFVYAFLPNAVLSVLLVQIASLALLAELVRRLALAMGGERSGWFGLVAAALYYPFGYYAASYSNVYPTMLFLTLAIVLLLPLLGRERSWPRGLAVGAALGVAVCLRGNFALVGGIFFFALWVGTRSLFEAVVRTLPIAVICLAVLGTMLSFNPPSPGQFTRGSQGMNSSLLLGSYQYADMWWDWDWNLTTGPYFDHEHELMKRSGEPAEHPKTQELMREAAWQRYSGDPANTLKKIAVSTIRIWVLVPTHLKSMPIKVAIAVQELALLGFAIAGLVLLRRNRGLFVLALGTLLVPTVTHWLLHVEPRYALPGKCMELSLAALAAYALYARLRGYQRRERGPETGRTGSVSNPSTLK